MELQPGTVFAGRFEVVRKIGDGGVGAVYEAVERAGVDSSTGCPWVAPALLSGKPLDKRLDRAPRLPRELVARLFAEMQDALGAAHQRGVIHADLKPDNLFLVGPVEQPTLKVLAFGIARALKARRTSAKVTTEMGTSARSAPEQFRRGARLRPSTDVWYVGRLAFQLLTGKHYLRSADGSVMAQLAEILHGALAPASPRAREYGVEAHLPAGFDACFALCDDREQEARFQHGRAASTALRRRLHPSRDAGGTVVRSEPPMPPREVRRETVALPAACIANVTGLLDRNAARLQHRQGRGQGASQ